MKSQLETRPRRWLRGLWEHGPVLLWGAMGSGDWWLHIYRIRGSGDQHQTIYSFCLDPLVLNPIPSIFFNGEEVGMKPVMVWSGGMNQQGYWPTVKGLPDSKSGSNRLIDMEFIALGFNFPSRQCGFIWWTGKLKNRPTIYLSLTRLTFLFGKTPQRIWVHYWVYHIFFQDSGT